MAEIQKKQEAKPTASSKIYAKVVQLGVGLDLLSSKTSLQAAKGSTLEVTPLGIMATSGKNGRVILVPWANVRGCELMPEGLVNG